MATITTEKYQNYEPLVKKYPQAKFHYKQTWQDFRDQRKTNTSTDKEIVGDRVQTQYIKIRRKYEQTGSKILNSPEEQDKLLLSLFYRDSILLGRGTTSITFKAINSQNQIGAVNVEQKSEGSLEAALLNKSINQDMANNL